LRNYVRDGLPYVRTGGHRRFRVEDLKAWVDGRVFQMCSPMPSTARSSNSASLLNEFADEDPRVLETMARLNPELRPKLLQIVSSRTRSKENHQPPPADGTKARAPRHR